MWTKIYGNMHNISGSYLAPYPDVKFIDLETSSLVIQESVSENYIVPLSALPTQRYVFDRNGVLNEFKLISYSENWPIFKDENDVYIYPINNGLISYVMSIDSLPPGTTPVFGEYTISGQSRLYGDMNFAFTSGSTLYGCFGPWDIYTSGQVNFYGTFSLSSIYDESTLSSSSLYGIYTNENNEQRRVGDQILIFSKNGNNYCSLQDYDSSISGYNVKCLRELGSNYFREDFVITKFSDSEFVIGTKGSGIWYTSSSMPGPNNSPVIFTASDGSTPLTVYWQGYGDFFGDYVPTKAYDLMKDDYTTSGLIGDPWRWLK